jgi:pimeloyl-ACP methyl ester carboxylesterase
MSFVIEPRHRTGSGDPLVLLHGFTGTWRMWLPVLPALASRFDVLLPTLGGHCGSDPFPDGVEPTISALADIAEAELDSAGIETAHLAGNSLGGWLALELAKRGRARSVVALSPAGGWWDDVEGEQRRLTGFFKRTHRMTSMAMPRARALVTRPRLRRLMFRDVMERGDRIPPGEAAHMMQGVVECSIFFDFMEAVVRDGPATGLDGITCPVLVGWCERDRVLPMQRYAEPYRDAIPGSELVVLHDCGHVPMYDDPDLVAGTIADFAARATLDASARDSHSSRSSVPAG